MDVSKTTKTPLGPQTQTPNSQNAGTVVSVPGHIVPSVPLGQRDYSQLVKKGRVSDAMKQGAGKAQALLADARSATGMVLANAGAISQEGVDKLLGNPNATTAVAGLGSVFAGVKCLQSFMTAIMHRNSSET